MGFVQGLRLMVSSIINSGQSLMWALVVMFLNMYLFAIFVMSGIEHYLKEEGGNENYKSDLWDFFGTVPLSLWTLFAAVTGGCDWGDIYEPLSAAGEWNSAIFL